MNLSEALNAALPELPVQQLRVQQRRPSKLDPNLIAREHIEDGKPFVYVLPKDAQGYYPFPQATWDLLKLYDGERTHAEVADEYTAMTGTLLTEEDARAVHEQLADLPIWYKTPQEKNAALLKALRDVRQKRLKKKSKWGDISMMTFPAVDPNNFLTWLYERTKFAFRPWFIGLNLLMFAFMIFIFFDRWAEIGRDTLEYYTFTNKGAAHLLEFWVLVLFLAFVHETAHGLTCKHIGGQVHRMGFLLIYLTPGFYCDTTEAWIYGERPQRIAVAIAGIWSEMILCAVATFIWWGTPRGTWVHEFAYTLMLITGVAVVVINMNPLIKLDGYTVLTESIGIPDLKERSTAYISGWVRRHIFRLPADLEVLPRSRKLLFIPYAILSGIYSYLLLAAIVRFAWNILARFTPDWAFIPALAFGALLFRSRIRTFGRFMKTLYLDKRERVRAWFTPPRKYAVAGLLLLLLVLPLWRESVEGRFILEPVARSVVRTRVPGVVQEVLVAEGQPVAAGAPLFHLRNLDLESEAAEAVLQARLATARAQQAQLVYTELGAAERQRSQALERQRLLEEQRALLTVSAPIAGIVLTSRPGDLLGSRLDAGTEVADIADLSSMRARVYLSEAEVRKIQSGLSVRLYLDALGGSAKGELGSVLPQSDELPEGLAPKQVYKGIRPPQYYIGNVLLPNPDGSLKRGMTGTAKVIVRRRSIVGFAWDVVSQFAGRKLW